MKRTFAALAAALVIAIGLSGCTAADGTIAAHAAGANVTVALPASPDASAESAAALAATDGLPVTGSYYMLRPSELTLEGAMPDSGVQLEFVLPADLPKQASARFAFFDPEAESWTPVPTTVSGRKLTATVHHLSQWTTIVTGDGPDFAGWLNAAGGAITDSLKWWSTDGPGAWIYRQGGLALGLQSAAPQCETGPLPGWVDHVTQSQLTGIPENNQNVLRCVGPDPSDPQLLQVKAAVNRAYTVEYQVAPGVQVRNREWSALPGMGDDDIAAIADALGTSPAFLDPRKYLLGTTEMSFSVSKADVKALDEGTPLVQFLPSNPMQTAVGYVTNYVLGYIANAPVAFFGVVSLVHSCHISDGAELADMNEVGEIVQVFVDCLGTLSDEDLEKSTDKLVQRLTRDHPTNATPFTSAKDAQAVKALRSVFKWIDAVQVGLTLIDYVGEYSLDPSVVTAYVKGPPSWEDAAGKWCNERFPDSCMTIDPPHFTFLRATPWDIGPTEELGGCIYATTSNPEGGYGGQPSLTFCPAGEPLPLGYKKMPLYDGRTDLFAWLVADDTPGEDRIINGSTRFFRSSR